MKNLAFISIYFILTTCCYSQIWEKTAQPLLDITAIESVFTLNDELYVSTRLNRGETHKKSGDNWQHIDEDPFADSNIVYYVKQFQNLVFVGTYTGNYFSKDSGETWSKHFEPMNDFIFYKVIAAGDKLFAIFSHKTTLDKRLFYTDDKAENWKPVHFNYNDKVDTLRPRDIVYDKGNLIAASSQKLDVMKEVKVDGGYFVSTDMGESWTEKEAHSNSFYKLFIFKDQLLVTTEDKYILRTTDHGDTWELDTNYLLTITDFTSDDKNIYASTYTDGFYLSSDSGKTWAKRSNGIYGGRLYEAIFFRDTLYVNNSSKGLYRSTDKAESWQKANVLSETVSYIGEITAENDTLFISGSDRGIHYSTDNGDSWNLYSNYLDSLSIDISVLRKSDNYVFGLLDRRIGNFVSSIDYGKTWREFSFEFFSTQPMIYDIFVVGDNTLLDTKPGLPEKISSDFGVTWDDIEFDGYNYNEGTEFIVNHDDLIYMYNYNVGSFISLDSGKTWSKNSDVNLLNDKTILSYETSKNKFYIGTKSGIYLSTDQGKSWNLLDDFSTELGNIYDMLLVEDNLIICTKKGIFHYKINTKEWENITSGITGFIPDSSNRAISSLEYSRGYLYCEFDGVIYRTTLDKLDIVLDVENEVERRNYLYTYPPFPQPAKDIVKAKFYWDINLPMTTDKINIYDILGTKINTEGRLKLDKRENHYGYIEWDCSNVQPGLYLIKINHGTETKTVKVMVGE